MAEPMTLASLAARDDADARIVARDSHATFSLRDWRARVRAWAAAFDAAGGGPCAMYFDDAFEFSTALFGAWHAGCVPWLAADALGATLQRLLPQVQLRAGALPDAIDAVDAAAAATHAIAPLDPAGCRLVLYTSGTSGEPVAIEKTLRQLMAEVDALEQGFGAALGDALVQGTVSHQHIYGLLFRVLWPLAHGRAFAPQRLVYPEQIAALREPCVLVATPAHLKRLPDTIDWRPFATSLQEAFSSGGPLPPDAAFDLQRLWGRAPIEVLGSTETGGIAWRRGGRAGSHWRALPRVEWRVVDDRLQVRSPHLADEHWYETQDRALAQDDGFQLLGRADRIVKLEERRIALGAIERRLLQSPLLDEARTVLIESGRALVAAVACPSAEGRTVLAQSGKRALTARLREWLDGHVDPIALPRRWRFVAALPVDARGKTSEAALRSLFRPRRPEPQWQQRDANSARLELAVDAELAAFDGHFPMAPVLPGVVMLDWVVSLAREAFAITGPCRRMEALKFQQIVQPGARLQIALDWNDASSALSFRIRSETATHAGGRLLFDPVAVATSPP